MLTAEHVRAIRKKGELKLTKLDAAMKERAKEIAATYLDIFRAHYGRTREELEEALDAVELEPRERVLARGLKKLLEDRAIFEALDAIDPIELREELFQAATAQRQSMEADDRFDRVKVIAAAAEKRSTTPEEIERALFSDLRSAQALENVEAVAPDVLVAEWIRGQTQAVLLRAVDVKVDIECSSAAAYRAIFRRLKFLRLLFTLERDEDDEYYRLHIDGPFSLFEQVTKYGIELAMFYPALEYCDAYRLEAEVKWGQARESLIFRTEGGLGKPLEDGALSQMSDEVRELVSRFESLDSDFKVRPADELLDLPGVGVVVPDLVFEKKGARVYLEVLGHWSRAAVWKRVELVEQGLGTKILFAVSARLRVSEEALGEEQPGALYVYKGTMSAKAILEKISALASRKR